MLGKKFQSGKSKDQKFTVNDYPTSFLFGTGTLRSIAKKFNLKRVSNNAMIGLSYFLTTICLSWMKTLSAITQSTERITNTHFSKAIQSTRYVFPPLTSITIRQSAVAPNIRPELLDSKKQKEKQKDLEYDSQFSTEFTSLHSSGTFSKSTSGAKKKPIQKPAPKKSLDPKPVGWKPPKYVPKEVKDQKDSKTSVFRGYMSEMTRFNNVLRHIPESKKLERFRLALTTFYEKLNLSVDGKPITGMNKWDRSFEDKFEKAADQYWKTHFPNPTNQTPSFSAVYIWNLFTTLYRESKDGGHSYDLTMYSSRNPNEEGKPVKAFALVCHQILFNKHPLYDKHDDWMNTTWRSVKDDKDETKTIQKILQNPNEYRELIMLVSAEKGLGKFVFDNMTTGDPKHKLKWWAEISNAEAYEKFWKKLGIPFQHVRLYSKDGKPFHEDDGNGNLNERSHFVYTS